MDIKVGTRIPARTDAVALLVTTDRTAGVELDWKFLEATGFDASVGSSALLPSDGVVHLVVGLGERVDLDRTALRTAGATIAAQAARFARVAIDYPDALVERLDPRDGGQALTEGLALGAYRFDKYRSQGDDAANALVAATIVSKLGKELAAGVARGVAIADGVCAARDIVNEPGGQLTAPALAKSIAERAMAAGLTAQVMDEKAIAKAKLGGLLAVNKGSTQPPRFVRLTYSPVGAEHTVALVGKGITFDSGGLSLKPAEAMMTMKMDKGGAAAVVGAMLALPALKPKVRVEGYLPITDNMPGPDAQRPGDIYTARNGKTVEVLNTDAEGRLILGDALALASEAKPDAIIDLATLTGACIVALGDQIAGLMGNDDEFVGQVAAAAATVGEDVWALPLPAMYRKMLDSPVADLKNIGSRSAGTLTAGLFLSEFVGEGISWAHLDIAGPAWTDEPRPGVPKGGTGFGVRTLLRLIERFEPAS